MKEAILKMLKTIEETRNIKILYAVESGSRAWGFASPDSDYDVRYIYIRRQEDYLRVDTLRDTIEGPLDEVMDFSGWDIRKTLDLMLRCNPSLMEWTQSPIVYLTTDLWQELAARIPEYFQVRANMHHYLSMAMGNWHTSLKPSLQEVKAKKYLYVLRPVLCCLWLEQFGTVPPVPFDRLCEAVLPEKLTAATAYLLEQKKQIDETALIPRIVELDEFIQEELPRLKEVRDSQPDLIHRGYDDVNRIFRQMLQDAWA